MHPLTSDFVHIDFVFAENHICRFDVPLVFSNQAACQAIKFGAYKYEFPDMIIDDIEFDCSVPNTTKGMSPHSNSFGFSASIKLKIFCGF